MAERRLAVVDSIPAATMVGIPTAGDLQSLLDLSDVLLKSKLLPTALTSREAVATVILKARELGVPPMSALEGISVIQGKAVVGSHLMLALVKRTYGPAAIWVSETTKDRCTVSYRVPGIAETMRHSFDIEDARLAGLLGKDNWKRFPAAMLRARAISAAVKIGFPEVVGGLYVAGELPGTVEMVTDDGEVIVDVVATAAAQEPPRAEPRPAPSRPEARAARPQADPSPMAEIDDDAGDVVDVPARPAARLNLGPLHAAVGRAARNGGDGMDGEAVHQFAHDWAARRFGVGSMAELTPQQLNALLREARDADAEWVATTWQEAQAGRQAGLGGMPAVEGEAGDGVAGADRWTE